MKYLLKLAAPVVLALALLFGPACPEDDSDSFFTGKTKTSATGKQLKQYKCYSFGHLFWAA